MTEYVSSDKKQWRKLYWDDENRLIRTQDNAGTVEYAYDEGGLRSRKKSALGETLYVNLQYSVRNGEVYSKHVFAGNTRLATTMVKRKGAAATELGVYYYHGDHLGSSNVITDRSGQFHEHLEYFPYGETWVHEKAAGSAEYMAHLFTGKEIDPETGLYDYGYRYLDPRLGRWASADPALARGDYMPSLKDRLVSERNGEEYQPEESLPGHGGVYNTINIDVYHYAGNNPIRFVDPDGLYLLLVELHKDRSKPGKLTLYDDNGKALGTFPVRGRGQGRDRMLEKGDTPTGIYLIEDRVSIDQNNDSYSSLGRFFLGLKAFFGEALEAREKGRGIATWRGGSGRIGVHGKGKERINDLVSTYGCLRIKEDDATIIESMIIDIEKERVSRTGQHPKIKDAVMVFEK
jgi:RHS repeat-associated protein